VKMLKAISSASCQGSSNHSGVLTTQHREFRKPHQEATGKLLIQRAT
jgi:hypothetical protein